jgi:glycosyltransferase involved in cell wall biosynthesis
MQIISIIIRTLNEEKHLNDLLTSIKNQDLSFTEVQTLVEVVIVDSGSNDSTLDIAQKHKANIVHISSDDFSFGRSLNLGCKSARGEILVFISGHCLPLNSYWLRGLCTPLISGIAEFVYGRQVGGESTKFSESRIFSKYFPEKSSIPQDGYYCNNANSATLKSVWSKHKFNESLTGLEDMEMAKRIFYNNERIGYISEAAVFHLHDESWSQIRKRFEREAIALKEIMPEVHLNVFDLINYYVASVYWDLRALKKIGFSVRPVIGVLMYRFNQYLGAYLGNHEHRILSSLQKKKYFYPK